MMVAFLCPVRGLNYYSRGTNLNILNRDAADRYGDVNLVSVLLLRLLVGKNTPPTWHHIRPSLSKRQHATEKSPGQPF